MDVPRFHLKRLHHHQTLLPFIFSYCPSQHFLHLLHSASAPSRAFLIRQRKYLPNNRLCEYQGKILPEALSYRDFEYRERMIEKSAFQDLKKVHVHKWEPNSVYIVTNISLYKQNKKIMVIILQCEVNALYKYTWGEEKQQLEVFYELNHYGNYEDIIVMNGLIFMMKDTMLYVTMDRDKYQTQMSAITTNWNQRIAEVLIFKMLELITKQIM